MSKQILTFFAVLLLCACAGGQLKKTDFIARKPVNFFVENHTQVAFKAVGELNGLSLEGVLVAKQIGDNDYRVTVLTAGTYRVLQATVSPGGVAYEYLFKEADTALIRARLEQFLHVLLGQLGTYKSQRVKNDTVLLTYSGPQAKTQLAYAPKQVYPSSARSSTLLNTADLYYSEYAPANEDGTVQLPHQLTYRDGKLTLHLDLISWR